MSNAGFIILVGWLTVIIYGVLTYLGRPNKRNDK